MDDWRVEQLGERTWIFFWAPGQYNSIFSVTGEGVIALDPISRDAAAHYREAIAGVTDEPIRYVVYSHDHLDHIVGAEVLAPEAEIVAHEDVPRILIKRGYHHVPLPTILVQSEYKLRLGAVTWDLRYLGPNHSDTNLAVYNAAERWVMLVDVVSAGYVPYRNIPHAEIPGFVETLDRLAELEVDTVLDGHCPPSGREWIENYRAYFRDLLDAARAVRGTVDERSVMDELSRDAGAVALVEAMYGKTSQLIADRLRAKYGHWDGFEEWAPLNGQRALGYLLTGN